MNSTSTSSSSLHPVIWIAGIAVTLFSLVGIASLTGLLPKSSPSAEPPPTVASAAAPAATPAAPPAATATTAEVATPAAAAAPSPAPVTHRKAAARHKDKPREVAALPPPDAGVPPDYVPPATKAAATCASCGVISDIREVKHEGQGSGLGAVGGGLLGGVVANNIGQGNGRTLATIAGMAGGALLGNKIEKSQRATVSYEVSVKMEDGTHRQVSYAQSPPWRVGDPVKVVDGTLIAR